MQHNQRDGFLLITLSVIGYSCLPVFTKNLYALGVAPLDIGFWRFFLTVPIFWAIVVARGRRVFAANAKPLPRLRVMAMGTLLGFAALAAFFGLERLPAGTFSVLFYSYPALVALIEAALGERLSSQAWLALGLTLAGVALTAPDFSAGFSGDNLPGILLALADALVVAVYMTASSRLLRGSSDIARGSAWAVTGALVVIAVLALGRGLALPQGAAWVQLAALALVSTVLPVFGLNAGIQKLGATRAAIIATFEPVLTAVLAMIFLGEVMQPMQWVGGALIIASVILLQARRRPAKAEPAVLAGD
ncbi:MAG: DMT family transporter [Anaerolineae bacterium]|nr:DMT family transporter [Anaerolineae bacterium]